MNRILNTRVAGVTFEGRQSIIENMTGVEACRLEPEPQNPHDPNAIAVKIAYKGGIAHIGYIPREIAQQIAPYLDGESLMCKIDEITGGFDIVGGERAAWGVRLRIEIPNHE